MTHAEIYEEFKKWSPWHAKQCVGYKPWGSTSILVVLQSGLRYKAKMHSDTFTMQLVSDEDVEKKYGMNIDMLWRELENESN